MQIEHYIGIAGERHQHLAHAGHFSHLDIVLTILRTQPQGVAHGLTDQADILFCIHAQFVGHPLRDGRNQLRIMTVKVFTGRRFKTPKMAA